MAIDLSTSLTAQQRGWGPGWPNCPGKDIVPLIVRGTSFPAGIHRELHDLVWMLLTRVEERGYKMDEHECWGFACRPIKRSDGSLTDTPSNHSWGLAFDVNAPDNPFGGTSHDIPPYMVNLFADHGFRWGGEYHGTKDWMHFEFMGRPRQARRMTRRAKRAWPALAAALRAR